MTRLLLYGGSLPAGDTEPMRFESRIASIDGLTSVKAAMAADGWRAGARASPLSSGLRRWHPRCTRWNTDWHDQGAVVLAGKVSMDMVTADITDLPARIWESRDALGRLALYRRGCRTL